MVFALSILGVRYLWGAFLLTKRGRVSFFLHALGGHHMAAEHCGLAQDMMGYVGLLWSLLPVTWGPGKIPKGTTPVTFFLQLGPPPKVFRTSQNSATCWESSEQPAKTFSVQSTVERTGGYVEKKGGSTSRLCLFDAGYPGSWAALELTE